MIEMAARLITVAETPLFLRQAEKVWSRQEHSEFVDYIAGNPEVGDVIGTGGIRKVRWGREGGWQARRGAGDLFLSCSRSATVPADGLREGE